MWNRNPCDFEHKRTFKNYVVDSYKKTLEKMKDKEDKEEVGHIGQRRTVDPGPSSPLASSCLSAAASKVNIYNTPLLK